MVEKINLRKVWSEIKKESGASRKNIVRAHRQILSQPEADRDMFAFTQAHALISAGGLGTVIEWIDATDMLPEEKLQRAKYFVNQVRIAESREAAHSGVPSRLLLRITDVLSQLATEGNK